MNIAELGWDAHFDGLFAEYRERGLTPARVALEHKQRYVLFSESGELAGQVSGRLQNRAASRADFPTVGDWVAVETHNGDATIHAVLPRRSAFSRKAVLTGSGARNGGQIDEQVLAANLQTVFLVAGLDNNFNLRRLERYLAAAWDGGVSPVIVLNKTDICENVPELVEATLEIAAGQPVHAISAATGDNLDELRQYLSVGQTAAFLGSSGVGKSTIVNSLLGNDHLDTGGVRLDDSRGRHTTTRRELAVLPGGGIVIDTPGLRAIQLWGDDGGISRTFADIEELFLQCRFSNCSHNSESGCAIQAALDGGSLETDRYQSYLKMQKEIHNLSLRKDVHAARTESRARSQYYRQFQRDKKKLRKKGLL
jgi:ribosome biogenesis GTPase